VLEVWLESGSGQAEFLKNVDEQIRLAVRARSDRTLFLADAEDNNQSCCKRQIEKALSIFAQWFLEKHHLGMLGSPIPAEPLSHQSELLLFHLP